MRFILHLCTPNTISLATRERAGGSQQSLLVQHSNREVITSLSKSDKIEQIKEKMLDMLSKSWLWTIVLSIHVMRLDPTGSSEVFISNDRLPWSTLESALEKQGLVLVNWPVGVPRKRSRGIRDLTAKHADKLYRAVMHPNEEHRLRIRSTVVPATSMLRSHHFTSSSKITYCVESVNPTIDTTHDPSVASSSKHTLEDSQHTRPSKKFKFKPTITPTS